MELIEERYKTLLQVNRQLKRAIELLKRHQAQNADEELLLALTDDSDFHS